MPEVGIFRFQGGLRIGIRMCLPFFAFRSCESWKVDNFQTVSLTLCWLFLPCTCWYCWAYSVNLVEATSTTRNWAWKLLSNGAKNVGKMCNRQLELQWVNISTGAVFTGQQWMAIMIWFTSPLSIYKICQNLYRYSSANHEVPSRNPSFTRGLGD